MPRTFHHVLRHRIMVAEFVARQSGSPINGETPSLNSSMPGSSNSSLGGVGGQDGPLHMGMSRAGSPDPENYPPGFDLASHLKRKELFSQRKQREFIPDNKKDESYWDRRRRNNEAAKRSREKRRFNDMILETRVVELSKENHVLKAQLAAIKDKYGISGESVVSVEQVMATLPTSEQVLSITKRPKLSAGSGTPQPLMYTQSPSPIPTSVIHQPVSTGIGSPPPPQTLHHFQPQPPVGQQHPMQESDGYPEPDTYAYNYPLPSLHPPPFEGGNSNNVLNLSRSRSRNIKQEPGVGHGVGARASPPWDGEGSSDERDSGISLGVEWGGHPGIPCGAVQLPQIQLPVSMSPASNEPLECSPDDSQLKSELARLASEVANLKSILTRKKNTSTSQNPSPTPVAQPQ
ncbi:Nuclear factor interleukin-3-regulated protein [Zootermopsis nevadensis]|uniref:Nuclear factor interleukin-3-regulated protein n=1 Tax=Zootermopsis nevadensis TaxID=136037 RepID=A0A067R9W9_ZOONE|nr:Nuclear factor interleukin-3-regulated protein [Zootermopsis nevadensis]